MIYMYNDTTLADTLCNLVEPVPSQVAAAQCGEVPRIEGIALGLAITSFFLPLKLGGRMGLPLQI